MTSNAKMKLTKRDRTPAAVPERLLGIWSHPDDEAYLSAGLMARTVANGGSVTVVSLTDGEGGFPDADPRCREERARHRRGELRTAMGAIGVTDLRFMGLDDGAMDKTPEGQVVDDLVALINEVQPDVVVTFGPDGFTGHDDHVVTWKLATRAWLTSDAQGELWYAARTESWHDAWGDLHDEFGVWMTQEPTSVRSAPSDIVLTLTPKELDVKRTVLAGHESQTAGLAEAFGEDRYRQWISEETFREPVWHELDAAIEFTEDGALYEELAALVG